MELFPLRLRSANDLVLKYHRHHKPVQGYLFAIGLKENEDIIGCAIIGRPVNRYLDNGYTAEVTRLVVKEGYPNACSMLYSASWRACKAMGYKKIITYILESESGISLKASGWKEKEKTTGGSWSSIKRPREDKAPLCPKIRYEMEVGTNK